MSDVRRPRSRAVPIFVAVVACIGAAFSACTIYHAQGEGCLKDGDCLSGLCVAQVCSSSNPILNGPGYPDDGGGTSAVDSGSSSPDSGSGSSSGGDSGKTTDAASDGPAAPRDSGRDTGMLDIDASDGAADIDSATDDAASDDGGGQDALFVLKHISLFA